MSVDPTVTKMSSILLTVLTMIVRAAECQFTGPKCFACSVTKGNANDLIYRLASVETLQSTDSDRPNMTSDAAKRFRERDFGKFLLGNSVDVTLCTDGTPVEVQCIDTLYACGTVTENKKVRAKGCINVPDYFGQRETFNTETKKAMRSCWYVDEAKEIEFCACSHAPYCNDQPLKEVVNGAKTMFPGPVCYRDMLIMSINALIVFRFLEHIA